MYLKLNQAGGSLTAGFNTVNFNAEGTVFANLTDYDTAQASGVEVIYAGSLGTPGASSGLHDKDHYAIPENVLDNYNTFTPGSVGTIRLRNITAGVGLVIGESYAIGFMGSAAGVTSTRLTSNSGNGVYTTAVAPTPVTPAAPVWLTATAVDGGAGVAEIVLTLDSPTGVDMRLSFIAITDNPTVLNFNGNDTAKLGSSVSFNVVNFTPTQAQVNGYTFAVTGNSFNLPIPTTGQAGFYYRQYLVTLTDGVTSADRLLRIDPAIDTAYTLIQIADATGIGTFKHIYPALAVNDQITYASAASLGVGVNRVDIDGYVVTDYDGSQNYSVLKAADGLVINVNGNAFSAGGEDVTPNVFSFTSQTAVAKDTLITSNQITISGLDDGVSVPISVTGGTYSKNSGAYTASAGTVVNGDTVTTRVMSASVQNTQTSLTLTVSSLSRTFTVTTAVEDVTIDPFSFTSLTDVAFNSVEVSNSVIISGLSTGASVAVVGTNGLSYSIDSGAGWGSWLTTGGTVSNGDSLRVRLTAANAYNTQVTGNINVGGFLTTFSVTTILDTVANAVVFTPSTNQQLNQYIESNTVTLTGVSLGADVSAVCTSSQISVYRNSVWTSWSSTATLILNEQFKLRLLTPNAYAQSVSAGVSLNNVFNAWDVTTRVDTDPDAFVLTPISNAIPDTLYESNEIIVGGIVAATPISVTVADCEIAIDAGEGYGAWSDGPLTISLNERFKLRLRTGMSFGTTYVGTVNLNGVIRSFNVTTGGAPTLLPLPFDLPSTVNAPINADVVSPVFSVLGISVGYNIPITVTNGEYTVNRGGSWEPFTNLPGEVSLGNQVQLRTQSSGSYGGIEIVVADINSVEFVWEVVSRLTPDITPDIMVFSRVSNAVKTNEYESNEVSVTGVDDGIDIPLVITNGSYEKNGQAATSLPGTVRLGDDIKMIANASSVGGTTKRVVLTIGGTQSTWEIVTAPDPQGPEETVLSREIGNIEPKIVDIVAKGIVGKTL